MLDGLRIMSKNIFGRAILAAFAALIVVGFGFFGIRDVFTNFRANQLATVGDAEIGVAQYRNEYQTDAAAHPASGQARHHQRRGAPDRPRPSGAVPAC